MALARWARLVSLDSHIWRAGRKQTRALTHTNTRHTDFTNYEQYRNPIFFDKLAPTCEYFKKPGQHRFC